MKRWDERVARQLRRDPEDVAPVPRRAAAARAAAPTRDAGTGRNLSRPGGCPDGRAILYVRFETDGEGFLHPDLFRWDPESGNVLRLTRFADVREADPCAGRPLGGRGARPPRVLAARAGRPGDRRGLRHHAAVGRGCRCAQPRVSPDGTRVVFVRHGGGAWELVVRSSAAAARRSWRPRPGRRSRIRRGARTGDTVFASVGEGGFVDVFAVPAAGGAMRQLTRTIGAALAPAPTPDGAAVFFLSLEADGLALRRLDLEAAPALERAPGPRRPGSGRTAARAGAGRTRRGRGGAGAPLRDRSPGGDPRRRGQRGSLGATVGARRAGWRRGGTVRRPRDRWRRGRGRTARRRRSRRRGGVWPVAVSLQLFRTRERPSQQPLRVPGLGESLDLDRRGVELAASWRRGWDTGGVLAGRRGRARRESSRCARRRSIAGPVS